MASYPPEEGERGAASIRQSEMNFVNRTCLYSASRESAQGFLRGDIEVGLKIYFLHIPSFERGHSAHDDAEDLSNPFQPSLSPAPQPIRPHI